MKKVVVLTSGGMDSTTLLFHHVRQGDEVRAIAYNYGQRHVLELECAKRNARELKVPLEVVDLSSLARVLPGSSQTDKTVEVPEGHYSAETMKATVVPNRNMILLAIAIGHAIAHKMDFVSYAAHAGDHTIYPDCRPAFAHIMNLAASLCDWKQVNLLRPFIDMSKKDIVLLGDRIGVFFSATYSCYKGSPRQCGRCGTCIERREAFYLAGIIDPTIYEADAPTTSQLVSCNWRLPA